MDKEKTEIKESKQAYYQENQVEKNMIQDLKWTRWKFVKTATPD